MSAQEPSTDDRLEREREFHDERFGSDERPADRFYAINRASVRWMDGQISEAPTGSRVLDYGCGAGAYSARSAARLGHKVTAIDLSPVAIEHARQTAEAEGIAGNIEFAVMDAENLELPDDEFDLVCGNGVIHHLDLDRGFKEITRVLKPSGRAAFLEPLGHNPVINLYRNRTPDQRSVDEHPLLVKDFATCQRWFSGVEAEYFHLAGLAALPFIDSSRLDGIVGRLDAVDRMLFRVPPVRRLAWMVGLRLTGPRTP